MGGQDKFELRRMQTLGYPELVDLAHTVFGADRLEPEKALGLAQIDADKAHHAIATLLTERLQSGELCICEIESTGPSPEFLQFLNGVHEELKYRRDRLTSLFESIPTHKRLGDLYREIIRELQSLTGSLIEFMPELAPIQSPSDPRWTDRNVAGFRLRTLIPVPSRLRQALVETRANFNTTATALQVLQVSIKLAAALQEARIAETRGLSQDFESLKQRLANDKAIRGPPNHPNFTNGHASKTDCDASRTYTIPRGREGDSPSTTCSSLFDRQSSMW